MSQVSYQCRRRQVSALLDSIVPGAPSPLVEYTEDEEAVWSTVISALAPLHQHMAFPGYLDLAALLYQQNAIPQQRDVSHTLERLTGFRFRPVQGLLSAREFFADLRDGVFPATQYIRDLQTPFFSREPDLIHEVVGHAAVLANPNVAAIYRLFGAAAAKARTQEEMMLLERLYWHTMEVGVILEEGHPKAFGAALLSSVTEMQNLAVSELVPFDPQYVVNTSYNEKEPQTHLFASDSFSALLDSLAVFLTA